MVKSLIALAAWVSCASGWRISKTECGSCACAVVAHFCVQHEEVCFEIFGGLLGCAIPHVFFVWVGEGGVCTAMDVDSPGGQVPFGGWLFPVRCDFSVSKANKTGPSLWSLRDNPLVAPCLLGMLRDSNGSSSILVCVGVWETILPC